MSTVIQKKTIPLREETASLEECPRMFQNVLSLAPCLNHTTCFFFFWGGDCICYSSLYFSVCDLYFTVTMKKASRTGPTGTAPESPPDRHYNQLAMVSYPTALGEFPLQSTEPLTLSSPGFVFWPPGLSLLCPCAISPALPLWVQPPAYALSSRQPFQLSLSPPQHRCLSAGLCLPSSLLGLNEDERQGLVVTEAGGAGREAGSLSLQKAVLLFMFGEQREW